MLLCERGAEESVDKSTGSGDLDLSFGVRRAEIWIFFVFSSFHLQLLGRDMLGFHFMSTTLSYVQEKLPLDRV